MARSRLAGISSRYAEIRRRRKRANLNKETANEFSRRAAKRRRRREGLLANVVDVFYGKPSWLQRFLNGCNHFHSEFPVISAATLATRVCDPQYSQTKTFFVSGEQMERLLLHG